MSKPLNESLTLKEATRSTDEAGILVVDFISAGWGSSGYYSPDVVEAAVPLFAEGTHMYFDHPSANEASDRPERSVRDLAAVIEGGASYDAEAKAIRGKVRPLKAYAELLTDEAFAKNVGLSIRGSATDIVIGEAEGRRGPIVEGLADIGSVDFVTRAGRGGRVLAVLESAGVIEATADQRREQLSDAVRTAYAGDNRYAWVQDYDDEKHTVWFEASAEDEASRTWQQSYTVADDDMSVALDGERLEVQRVTNYVPVARPGSTTTTESHEETQMGTIQIEETEHARLTEKAGRVETLETERDTAVTEAATEKARADKAEAELAERDRRDAARKIVDESDGSFTPLEMKGLLAELPLNEGGELDVETFTTTVAEAAAKTKRRGVHGFGGTPVDVDGETVTEADIDNAVGAAFGRTVKEA